MNLLNIVKPGSIEQRQTVWWPQIQVKKTPHKQNKCHALAFEARDYFMSWLLYVVHVMSYVLFNLINRIYVLVKRSHIIDYRVRFPFLNPQRKADFRNYTFKQSGLLWSCDVTDIYLVTNVSHVPITAYLDPRSGRLSRLSVVGLSVDSSENKPIRREPYLY